ncbi:hypothetical protein PILCRDRAFT_927 [Piloderma croceum F 1598]|uniref:Uncharacterized protein n=1 Tax=Piloderma croceum (strain F 1598) TaxID=765440 RepID=A0A0C3G313_PILCF|nr:hypothetical protein PILCRDRAFT_927 [Piloderma croceum F 1598]
MGATADEIVKLPGRPIGSYAYRLYRASIKRGLDFMNASVNCLWFPPPVKTATTWFKTRLLPFFSYLSSRPLLYLSTIRMRAHQPHFPSIALVLSQASFLMHSTNHPTLLPQKPKTLMVPVHDDSMQTVDERDQISLVGLDAFTHERNIELASLCKALTTQETGDQIKRRRLSISSLVIDLAITISRKCHRFGVKNHE